MSQEALLTSDMKMTNRLPFWFPYVWLLAVSVLASVLLLFQIPYLGTSRVRAFFVITGLAVGVLSAIISSGVIPVWVSIGANGVTMRTCLGSIVRLGWRDIS